MNVTTNRRFDCVWFACHVCGRSVSRFEAILLHQDVDGPAEIVAVHRGACESMLQREAQRLGLPRWLGASLTDLALALTREPAAA